MSANAFSPQPLNSLAIACTSTSSTPSQKKGTINNGTQRLIYNAGPNDAWLASGPTSTLTAAVPTAGVPANGVAIPAGAILTLTYPIDAYFAAICKAGETATIYMTSGEGV